MAKYIVEQMARVWIRVEVESKDEVFAREQGEELIANGEGVMQLDYELSENFWVAKVDSEQTWSFN